MEVLDCLEVGGVKNFIDEILEPLDTSDRGFAVWGLIVRLYRTNRLSEVLTNPSYHEFS